MIPNGVVRVDMHCHSTASEVAKLGIQRSVGLPECATPPEEVYELAKRRGMDFVTITDHDTIDGCLELADRPDVLRLRGADRLVRRRAAGGPRPLLRDHPDDHEFLQAHAARPRDLRRLPARARDHLRARASVLRRRGAAEPAPPPAPGRAVPGLGDPQRLAGARAQHARRGLHRDPRRHRDRRLRRPRRRRHRAHLDRDPARVDAGRVSAPRARGPRRGRGDQGSAAKWAHSALALAIRALSSAGSRTRCGRVPAS